MKRVIIFSIAYYPHVGGAEVAIKEITDRIGASDIEFHMVTMRFSRADAHEEKIGNISVHRVGPGSSSYGAKILFIPRAARIALALHREKNFDAAWAVMSYMTLPLMLMRILGVRLPYVLNLQDGDPFGHVFKRWFITPFRPLLRHGFRGASVVQPLSRYLAQWAIAMGYRGPIELIPQGVDVKKFSGLRQAHTGVVLVTTSRLVHKNAIDDVIRALPRLPDITFRIFGIGPDEEMLKGLAQELGVSGRVEFDGFLDNAELPAALHGADIFIRPSRTEGFGISFIEAMAAGLPVVATQEGGIADFLFDAKRNPEKPATGWAVDKDSPEQIVQTVRDILANPEAVRRVIQNAQKMVMNKYDWNLVARDMREKVFARIFKTG